MLLVTHTREPCRTWRRWTTCCCLWGSAGANSLDSLVTNQRPAISTCHVLVSAGQRRNHKEQLSQVVLEPCGGKQAAETRIVHVQVLSLIGGCWK